MGHRPWQGVMHTTFTSFFTLGGNLVQSVQMLACFWKVGGNPKTQGNLPQTQGEHTDLMVKPLPEK